MSLEGELADRGIDSPSDVTKLHSRHVLSQLSLLHVCMDHDITPSESYQEYTMLKPECMYCTKLRLLAVVLNYML